MCSDIRRTTSSSNSIVNSGEGRNEVGKSEFSARHSLSQARWHHLDVARSQRLAMRHEGSSNLSIESENIQARYRTEYGW